MRTRIYKLIPLVLMLVGVTAIAWAYFSTPIPSGGSPATVSASAALPGPVSTADMRPVGWITTHGAPRTAKNLTGLRRQLIDPNEGYRWLLDQFLTRPFERFLIHQPAGWAAGKPQAGAQYWPIDEAHQQMWERAIRDAIRRRPEITIGIYGALNLRFTHSTELPDWHRASFDNLRDRWAVWQQSIAPWVRAGAYEYWWDNASPSIARSDAVLFSRWLAEHHGVRAGIEAIPTHRDGAGRSLDRKTMNQLPSLALLYFVRAFDQTAHGTLQGSPMSRSCSSN